MLGNHSANKSASIRTNVQTGGLAADLSQPKGVEWKRQEEEEKMYHSSVLYVVTSALYQKSNLILIQHQYVEMNLDTS